MSSRLFDVVVIGAGFAGLYALHRLRAQGYSITVLEAAPSVGGTWYLNRYPGARCDIESVQYSYSFSPELEKEWTWSERYAAQPEILRYINHVADRFDLRRDIHLNTRVVSARWDDGGEHWQLGLEDGSQVSARFVISATGVLTVPLQPDLPGFDAYQGPVLRSMEWPEEGFDFSGKRVGIIGTGSTSIQIVPVIAPQAKELFLFQRTPNYSIPGHNHALGQEASAHWKENRSTLREAALGTRYYILYDEETGRSPGAELDDDAFNEILERRWSEVGGFSFSSTFSDMSDPRVNTRISEFVRRKIGEVVHAPDTAQALKPRDHGLGIKRICVDHGYYETFNRPNVHLVNLRQEPIDHLTETGIKTSHADYEIDVLVLALGFDAYSGALFKMNLTGRDGHRIQDHWAQGLKANVGTAVAGFPNWFLITGPGSPSVLTNMVTSIQENVDWISKLLAQVREQGASVVETTQEAEDEWFTHVQDVAGKTISPEAFKTMLKVGSWRTGANIPGKPRAFVPYLAPAPEFKKKLDALERDGYPGFRFSGTRGQAKENDGALEKKESPVRTDE